MFTGAISASILSSLIALTSLGGISADSFKSFIPRASAQVTSMQNRAVIDDIDPTSGPTGVTVTLTGKKFTDESIVRFGKGAIEDSTVSDDGTTLTFVVPEEIGKYCPPNRACTEEAYEVTPGNYNVRVQNGNKASNVVKFEVTDTGTNPDSPLSILGVSGPTDLDPGEEGTWTVDVESTSTENLQYSVKWGDENASPLMRLALDSATQSSATFTHTYDDEGTYTPEFTVTDAEGNTVTKSASSVVVSDDEPSSIPHITEITPTSGNVGSTITLMGSNFGASSTVTVGAVSATDVVVESDTKITFEIPAVATGTQAVVVKDGDETSNSVDLTVTAPTPVKTKVSVSGVSAPTRLTVGEDGTWTVNASSNAAGNLEYSVDWGDSAGARRMSATEVMTQSSATFTHSYETAGTYKPKFTVTDENGRSASVSASVVVEAQD